MTTGPKTFNPRGQRKGAPAPTPRSPKEQDDRVNLPPRVERFHTSVTERGGFRTCRRRWLLDTVERLQHKDRVAWALIFGECIHYALQAYYAKNRRNLNSALIAFREAWDREDKKLRQIYGAIYSLGIEEEWYGYREKGKTMLTYYDIYDRQSDFKWDKVIATTNVEERIFVDILGPGRRTLPGRPLLSGRPDLIVERHDGIWIIDHKTAATAYDARALDVDDQLTGLAYLWWRVSGQVPRGAIYNALIKEPPKPPKINQDGRPSRDKAQRTTYDLYVQAMKDQGLRRTDPDFAEILAYLKEKRWNQFFVRDGLTKNLEELQSFEQRLYYEYTDMHHVLKNQKRAYPNPSQMNCGSCGVLPICQTMEEQGDPDYLKQQMYIVQEPRVEIPDEVLDPDWEGV